MNCFARQTASGSSSPYASSAVIAPVHRHTGALRGIDLSIKSGKIGLGSFFETAQFRNLKVINGS